MIIYVHGFNSSPASHKANQLQKRLAAIGQENEFTCPALSHWPQRALADLKQEVAKADVDTLTLVGSSLGGFYATWLTEHLGCRSVLVNPAITPHEGLRAYLGKQRTCTPAKSMSLRKNIWGNSKRSMSRSLCAWTATYSSIPPVMNCSTGGSRSNVTRVVGRLSSTVVITVFLSLATTSTVFSSSQQTEVNVSRACHRLLTLVCLLVRIRLPCRAYNAAPRVLRMSSSISSTV